MVLYAQSAGTKRTVSTSHTHTHTQRQRAQNTNTEKKLGERQTDDRHTETGRQLDGRH